MAQHKAEKTLKLEVVDIRIILQDSQYVHSIDIIQNNHEKAEKIKGTQQGVGVKMSAFTLSVLG